MFEQDVVKPGYLFCYILALLAASWGILLLSASGFVPGTSLVLLPLIPGILALLFLTLEGHPIEVHARPILGPVTIPATVFAALFPFLLLGISALVALGTGLGSLNAGARSPGFVAVVVAFIAAIPAALGQEYGYRGYLLPALTYWQGRIAATVSVGLVWGLATAPAVFLALARAGSGDPSFIAILGFLFTVAVAFAFSCCYYLSGSILPVTLMNILFILAIPLVFTTSGNPAGIAPRGLIGVTWPSPLPLLILVSLAFVPVFTWLFLEMDGGIGSGTL